MNKFKKWVRTNRDNIIRNAFLLPILLVVLMSINHVIRWYDIGNPISWAIYLSIAIEIFALASVAAASIRISKAAIWFLFTLVTSIQIIGNIFFSFSYIDVNGEFFLSWTELVAPLFDGWSALEHKRLLAIIQGGTLPIMSLTALYFYIKFNDKKEEISKTVKDYNDEIEPSDWGEDISEMAINKTPSNPYAKEVSFGTNAHSKEKPVMETLKEEPEFAEDIFTEDLPETNDDIKIDINKNEHFNESLESVEKDDKKKAKLIDHSNIKQKIKGATIENNQLPTDSIRDKITNIKKYGNGTYSSGNESFGPPDENIF